MERCLSEGSMNDLISREQLINKLNSTGTNITFDIPVEEILGENVDLDDFAALMQDAIQAYRKMVIDTIKNMPTAYDTNKILEQLEEEKELSYADFDRYVKEVSSYLDAEYDDFFYMGIERAIRIIKVGDLRC